MLFYGDIDRFAEPSSIQSSIARKIRRVIDAAPGRARHEVLVRVFIETGELAQGLADRDFEKTGVDDISDTQNVGARLLLALAHAVKNSWEDGFAGDLCLPGDWALMLDRLGGSGPVRLKRGEGYAFYCLYPENYLEAASASKLPSNTVVIGLRSIGTSLAALVAAALDARPAFTVRPVGHPFDRRATIAPALAKEILKDPSANFAVVDEGPGLSGSSFGCVADWLLDHGIEPRKIHFFPSHGGRLGPHASPAHETLWERQSRHVVTLDETIARCQTGNALQDWASHLVGERPKQWIDISGGGWRGQHYAAGEQWPAVHASMERRKFLMRADDRAWLVKFTGIDELAHQRMKAGAALAEAGFIPRQAGSAYGFLVEEWLCARPADVAASNNDVIDLVGRYLGFRARHLPAPQGGASLSDLCAMALFNTERAVGAARVLKARLDNVGRLPRRLRRVDTDNKLHRWEWLIGDDSQMLKTDAIDHCAAHDFVGCQDIAWDIAGAAVEFGLSARERERLAAIVAAEADSDTSAEILDVFEFCYLAFQLGFWTYARMAATGTEAARIESTLKRYADRLAVLLDEQC